MRFRVNLHKKVPLLFQFKNTAKISNKFLWLLIKTFDSIMKQNTFSSLRAVFSLLVVSALVTTTFIQTISSQVKKNSIKSKSSSVTGPTPPPQYQIFDIGLVNKGDSFSQGFGVSPGGIAVGRSLGTAAQAFTWTLDGGIVGLPNLAGRNFCVSNGANDTGDVAGTCATTVFGSGPLPTIWQNGIVSQLPLPSGETLGRANDINSSGIAVGSVNGGSLERAAIYNGTNATVITQTTSNGSFFTTAFGINDSGLVAGIGLDPNNAARNVGLIYQIPSTWQFGGGTENPLDIGALPGKNGAIPFGIGNGGHVVGASTFNTGSGMPFIWTQAGGMVAIPLPTGTSEGSARAVNSSGWAVGRASSAFSIPFLYDGTNTYRLADLIPAGTGWDLSMNTSSSADGISESNVIIGTGVFNGDVHAFAMVPMGTTVGGRIMTAIGFGIPNAIVTLSGGNLPTPLTTRSNSFGYYSFSGLQFGQTYTLSVQSRQFTWQQPMLTINLEEDVKDFDFVADQR
jgi:hypothetical protein